MNKKELLILIEWLLLTIFYVCLSPVLCIVGRDLVLTPRQGLQLTGKSIYYEEDSNEVLRNLTVHPWERTLKHVTFVTLFTDAAAKAVAGNISKLKEYTDFLESPYINKENANAIRFGDIVMLANGRLEQAGNHTFRFIEGTCGYDCEPERVWALWQVQKIRHRDQNHNFRYEMKFSVSPLRTEAQLDELRKQAEDDEVRHGDMYVRRNALKTYIQREDDYPQSFGRIIYPEETAFAQKRQDEVYMGRNFRQVSGVNDYRQVTPLTPLPQPTFMHPVFQPHYGLPPPPPPPQRLNIGEYVKGFIHPKATPKIELFPNLYNLMNRNSFPTPTTFRPNYQIKLPRPEIYQPPPDMVRFPENRNEVNLVGNKLNPPLVTHHFHHHFFMPGSGEVGGNNSGENHINSGAEEQEMETGPARFDKELNRQVTPNYYNNHGRNGGYYEGPTTPKQQESNLPPAPHKISFPIVNFGEHIVEVTPPPLKKPQIYPVYPINLAGKVPVLVYAASTPPKPTTATTTTKPFIHSEPITDTVRYSEPDPLYATDTQSGTQVESPYFNTEATVIYKRLPPEDSIEAQLTSPEREKDLSIQNEKESLESNGQQKTDQILNHSQKEIQILPENGTRSTLTIDETQARRAATTQEVSTTTTTTSNPIISPPRHVTTPIPSTTETPTTRALTQHTQIVSTSTTETPLRAVSRSLRKERPTTTTAEPTILKWKPKRRNQHSNFKYTSQNTRNADHKHLTPKSTVRKNEITPPTLFTSAGDSNNLNTTNIKTPQKADDEILEVLTQKSVSRSVSVKVGNNGEEIPFINDNDAENEVIKE